MLLKGILPLVWNRSYYSDQDGIGWLGEGWSVPGCQRIIRDAAGLAYIDDQGRLFPLLEVDEDDEEPVLFESEQIWFSKEPGRALCHCFAERFDSVAFCAFGGRGRRFGRRLYPLPAGGGGRRQRQPPAFRLSRWPVCRNTSSTATAGCSHWTSAMWRTSNIITTTTTS